MQVKVNEKNVLQYFRKNRTVYDYPGIISVQRVKCRGDFFTPDLEDINDKKREIEDYFSSEGVGLILPLASEREHETFPNTLAYAMSCGITPERTIVIYSPQAQQLVDSLKLKHKGYHILNETTMLDLFDTDRIHKCFAVDIVRQKGKGRAFLMGFAYLRYVSPWKNLEYLFFMDVDTNANQYQPLHYLGYSQAVFPDNNRLFLLTAQNNALRDNHYLFVMRDYWRQENQLGRHYAAHFDELVWSLTGEAALKWNAVSESIPFTLGYGLESVWQLFAADCIAPSKRKSFYQVSQVVNPQTKKDGGDVGQSGRCYDATMYRQLNLMVWTLIKHGQRLDKLTTEDYHAINSQLSNSLETMILPDNGDHGLPYRVRLQSDLFIPPLKMLAAENCLRI